ncbi:MAG TPA: PHP domain-containing protein [Candidatus Thermoplasmatota archaeon]|nr:PHP domain-containing protein [Candidatus Thermoplasmatota archaeon]
MKERVVRLLREMADAMRKAGDRHRVRAYSRAANNIERRQDFDVLYDNKRLQDIAGVGPAIEKKIIDFVEHGTRPDWLDDPRKVPEKLRGSAVTRARAAAGGLEVEADPPQAYFETPFFDAPDLHVHTTWSDGTLSLEEVVEWAKRLQAPAVGISDHSGSLRIANGLRPDEVREQWAEIERLQAEHPDILILRGTECDILRDGTLDHPEDLLAEFDYVIGSLHSSLKLDKAQQTERVLRALDCEHLTILGHPTTRVPNYRAPANLDLDRIFEKAAERGVAMEVNGNPGRIDLDIPLAKKALEHGCKLAVTSDGHSAREMLSVAVAKLMASEAGATEADIVNYDVMGDPRAGAAGKRRGLTRSSR